MIMGHLYRRKTHSLRALTKNKIKSHVQCYQLQGQSDLTSNTHIVAGLKRHPFALKIVLRTHNYLKIEEYEQSLVQFRTLQFFNPSKTAKRNAFESVFGFGLPVFDLKLVIVDFHHPQLINELNKYYFKNIIFGTSIK